MGLLTSKEKKSPIIKLGNEEIEVKPLTLENSLRLVLLLGPYVGQFESKWPQIQAALKATNGTRPKLLETIFRELRQELTFMPGDLVQVFALCLNRDIAEVATRATAKDLIEAWPILDEINDFRSLFETCKALGITMSYGS